MARKPEVKKRTTESHSSHNEEILQSLLENAIEFLALNCNGGNNLNEREMGSMVAPGTMIHSDSFGLLCLKTEHK